MSKKILAAVLAVAMILGVASVALAASPFPDTEGVEEEAIIAKLKTLGLVKGDDAGNFNPYSTINRAEFATMVVRMVNLEGAAGFLNNPTVFPDVTEVWSWAYGYINIATGRGLVKGFPDGTFRPGEPVTQAEAITMLLRALGYSDNLPGVWPINYIMKAAELDMLSTGFAGGAGASRALVAELVASTLDQAPVKEDKDSPGVFTDKYNYAVTLYEDVFGLRAKGKEQTVEGRVTAYSSGNGTITIDGDAYPYVSGVTIFGKEKLAELIGQEVIATFNKDGKVIFIEVTTVAEVIGEITAVDTVNNKVTVGGTKYTVLSGAEVYKNGAKLTTTIAGALADVKGSDAVLLLDSSGKVYRIDASKLDITGYIASKRSVVGANGTVTRYVTVGTTEYQFTSSTIVVRNGATAGFADLKKNDHVKLAEGDGHKLVHVDAFCNVIEGYKVVGWSTASSGRTLTVVKDGVESTFALHKDTSLTGMELNKVYDLTLNRDGKVTGWDLHVEEAPTTGKIKTVDSKDQYYSEGTKHRVTFTDGTVLVLDALTHLDSAERNGIRISASASDIWSKIGIGDLFRLEGEGTDTKPYGIYLYAKSVSGRLSVRATGVPETYELKNENGTATARARVDWDTEVTLNGKRVFSAPVYTGHDAAYTAVITYTGQTDIGGVPKAKTVVAEDFRGGIATAMPITSIETGDSTTFTVQLGDGSSTSRVVYDDTIIMKGGVKVTAADVEIGNKLQVSADGKYVKVSTDSTAPKVSNVAAVWNDTDKTLTVTFYVNEPCRLGYVWVGGKQYSAGKDGAGFEKVIELTSKPSSVTVAAVDYAGNVSATVDQTVN